MTSSIKDIAIKIISEQLGVPIESITLEKEFVKDLGLDSLDAVELVMEFEDEFGITISDEDYEKTNTVGEMMELLNVCINKKVVEDY